MRLAKPWPDGPLVFGHDEKIAEFVARRIPYMGTAAKFGQYTAIGVIRHNKLIGGVVYNEFKPEFKSVVLSYAFDSPQWATPRIITSMAAYPFMQLGCIRMTTLTPRKNKRSRKFVEGVGFTMEGCVRKGFLYDDAIIYGMLRHECRWLEGTNEQEHTTAARAT